MEQNRGGAIGQTVWTWRGHGRVLGHVAGRGFQVKGEKKAKGGCASARH